jgi:hypothetical protein
MAPAALSFGDIEYWDKRFQSEDQFEWLLDYSTLEPYLVDAINQRHGKASRSDDSLQLLHIGCGSSNLSTQLRSLVPSPQLIHNVDYSRVAVERGQQRERDEMITKGSQDNSIHSRWSTLDLLDVGQISDFSLHRDGNRRYDIILDKSTSDAISCAPDIEVSIPYNIKESSKKCNGPNQIQMKARVHPLYILAVHLAFLAAHGCRWVVLSYSNARFSFWDEKAEREMGFELPGGFIHPASLWRLIKHEKIEKSVETEETKPTVHRPPETLHMYILERTQVELNVL